MIRWMFDIDVVGGCNLRCPSCPVGNSDYARVPKGYMAPELLDRILAKAKGECDELRVGLYNWTEPFLHPDLAAMIRVVKSHGIECGLSTNLNILNEVDRVLAAEPNGLRVSVSGFRQDIYGRGHKRGNIEKVKANMIALAEAKARTGSGTKLTMFYHRYIDNLDDEPEMRRHALSLGFKFTPIWAYMMPLEKNLAFAKGGRNSPDLTDEDRAILDRLALPLDEAIEAWRPHRAMPCSLRDEQMALTVEGRVMLCCFAYDQAQFGLGNFLELPLAEIQALKNAHPACGPCMKNGLHVLSTYATKSLDAVALANVRKQHPGIAIEGALERRRGGVARLLRRALGQN